MAKIEQLSRLVSFIEAKLAALPAYDYRDDAACKAHNDALDNVFSQLEADEGATTRNDYRGAVLRMAGVISTSTGGKLGALQNWKAGAEKRISKLREAGDA